MDIFGFHIGFSIFSTIFFVTDLLIRLSLSVRVIMRKRSYGVTLAWLVVILLVPFLGVIFYLLFGENRIPEKRIELAKVSYEHYQHWLSSLKTRAPVDWSNLNPECSPLHRQAEVLVGIPAMAGNNITLISNPDEILNSIIEGINNARSSCHLQFYIWQEGGRVDEITESLIRAANRGVTCRILLDSIGSNDFLKSPTASRMKAHNIQIRESLPAGIIKALFSRIDIRNHRKLVLIDGAIAYTGSQNMIDPAIYKLDAGYGNWIDLMVKVEGPVVESLAGTFISDWFLESEMEEFQPGSILEDLENVRELADIQPRPIVGECAVQLVPSGPGFVPEAIHSLLLTTIYAARQELIMTTPYFIPDDPLLVALKAAAQRGVEVKLIVPQNTDSLLVKYASRAHYENLMNSGVKIFHFTGGLLHSKTITVDGDFSLFGSVNLDMRSFWLNFEATLFIYCKQFTTGLVTIQKGYLAHSKQMTSEFFSRRNKLEKFKENAALLVSPLL